VHLASAFPDTLRQCSLQYSPAVDAVHLQGGCAHFSVFSATFIPDPSFAAVWRLVHETNPDEWIVY
jgi:hypothetical protein